MKINATDNFFTRAKPIWAKGLEKEKNITYNYSYVLDKKDASDKENYDKLNDNPGAL